MLKRVFILRPIVGCTRNIGAVQSLENACRVDVPLPLVAGLKSFYKHGMVTFDPSRELGTVLFVWRVNHRPKQ